VWRLLKHEVEPGLGEEAFDEVGPVLHAFEPGLLSVGITTTSPYSRNAVALLDLDYVRWAGTDWTTSLDG
jgi:hypothetical protein